MLFEVKIIQLKVLVTCDAHRQWNKGQHVRFGKKMKITLPNCKVTVNCKTNIAIYKRIY